MSLSQEECNNFDDNCNQMIDEDLFAGCYTGPEGTIGVGICIPGELTCDAGVWGNYSDTANFTPGYCKGEVTPQPEICNGEDDDCDGEVDWGKELADTDILFIIDWSGSMGLEIDAVLVALNTFAQTFSDEEVLQWAVILGPREVPGAFYNERLELYHDLSGFSDFLQSMSLLNFFTMNTGTEMLLDAMYLALYNISAVVPYDLLSMSWGPSSYIADSDPTLQDFKVSWRANADRVIIVFSDEVEQSYLSPTVTTQQVEDMVAATPQLKVYTFSTNTFYGWDEIAQAGSGKYFQLTQNPTSMYNNLMEILDEICKGGEEVSSE
jgi:hypothetical protein